MLLPSIPVVSERVVGLIDGVHVVADGGAVDGADEYIHEDG